MNEGCFSNGHHKEDEPPFVFRRSISCGDSLRKNFTSFSSCKNPRPVKSQQVSSLQRVVKIKPSWSRCWLWIFFTVQSKLFYSCCKAAVINYLQVVRNTSIKRDWQGFFMTVIHTHGEFAGSFSETVLLIPCIYHT